MNWCILDYEKDRHTALPNSLCRFGIACVIPMVTEYSAKGRVEYPRPALPGLCFIPCEEAKVRLALETVRYVDAVWRRDNGDLVSVPDQELQLFMDGLAKREKRPPRVKKGLRLGDMAEADWFATYSRLYGLQAAVKRFGRDLREMIAA